MSPGEVISRWNSDLVTTPAYSAQLGIAYGTPAYNPGGDAGYTLVGNPPYSDLLPVQIPSRALNDLDVSNVTIIAAICISQSAGQRPGPGAIASVQGTLLQNQVPFISLPLAFSEWGFGSFVSGAPIYTFAGTYTPPVPFPIYLSDTFQLGLVMTLVQPVPQDSGIAAPTTGDVEYKIVDPSFARTLGLAGNYSKVSFIGTQTPKDTLF
jgi:hypothetical protein